MFTAMKRLFFILSFGAVACSGEVTIKESEIKPDLFYADGACQPFTGKCMVTFNDTSLVKDRFTYKKGILSGEASTYYKNGQLRRRGNYLHGKFSGKWEFWDEKGNKTMEANYLNDSLNGAFIVLYTNGKVKESGQFSGNVKIGRWTKYDEKGDLVEKQLLRN